MARGPRLDAPGSLRHVIVRGIERRRIFESKKPRSQDIFNLLNYVSMFPSLKLLGKVL
jgi:hypothetical protein